MTPHQATQVIAALTAAWPTHDMPDDTMRLWVGLLADVDQGDAMEAARTVVKEDRFFPPISRFLQLAEERCHARRNREATERGLPRQPPQRVSPERMTQILGGLRAQLAARRGAGGHWHGGPNPCPVCGGMAPPTHRRPQPTEAPRPPSGTPLRTCGIKNCRTCNKETP